MKLTDLKMKYEQRIKILDMIISNGLTQEAHYQYNKLKQEAIIVLGLINEKINLEDL